MSLFALVIALVVFVVGSYMDFSSSIRILALGGREVNPLLRARSVDGFFARYVLLTAALIAGLCYLSGDDWRGWALVGCMRAGAALWNDRQRWGRR